MTTFHRELTSLWMEEAKRRAEREIERSYAPDSLSPEKRQRLVDDARIRIYRQLAGL